MEKSPFRPVDDAARTLARELLETERTAALAVILPDSGAPHVSRIGLATGPDGQPITLISSLARHTGALRARPDCSLMVGTAPSKGDPLAFPRMTMAARAVFVPRAQARALRENYLARHPKARLYVDFADFDFVLFQVDCAELNGGFGKAYNLKPQDLCGPGPAGG